MAKNKAKDLHDIGISIELVPLVLKGESNSFDYSMFYGVGHFSLFNLVHIFCMILNFKGHIDVIRR